MRLLSSLLPAGLITALLFALMSYLISSSHRPLKPPVETGFVDFIRMQRDIDEPDPTRALRRLPDHQQLSAASPPLPQPALGEVSAPILPPLSIPVPDLPSPAPDGEPYLDAYVPPPPNRQTTPTTSASQLRPAQNPVQSSTVVSVDGLPGGEAERPGAGEPGTGLGELGDLSRDAIPLLKIEPAYPRKAARAKKEGWVKVEFTITEQGQVLDPVVIKSRPKRTFNRSALAAIRKWRFQPKLVDGKPVTARATQIIEFKLAKR